MKITWAYSLKVFTELGFSIWMMAAPSMMVQVTFGLSEYARKHGMEADHSSVPVGDFLHQTALVDMIGSHVERTQGFHLWSGKQ